MLNYLHTCPTCLTFQQQVLELVVIIFVHLLHKGGQKAHTLAEVVVIDECGRCIETRPLHRNPAVAAVFCSPNSLYIYSAMEWKCHSVKQKRIDRVSAEVWETSKHITILEEVEKELLEEEFYMLPRSPSRLSGDLSEGHVRIGGARVHTPAHAERLLGLHNRNCTQLLVSEPVWRDPE
jgi:hypothetical protein